MRLSRRPIRSKILTRSPEPTTGIRKTATAAGPTAIVLMPRSLRVTAVVGYLQSLTRPIKPNCDPGHYYILNNYNPGFNGDGSSAAPLSPFTIPPTSVRHIGDALMEKNVSFKYYGDGWNLYLSDPNYNNPANAYCNICNPFQYATDIMTNAT